MPHPAPIAPPAATACIGLGSNVGDRAAHLAAAVIALRVLPDTEILEVSDTIETDPVGPVAQGPFLNAVVLLSTRLPASRLLHELLMIERSSGRDRNRERRWGPRTLDLDLLLYGGLLIDEPGLTVPHPRLHERLFVLEPLAQVAPDLVVPGLGRTVRRLLDEAHSAARSGLPR